MTSPRDEIDDWLAGEVAPLNPPPGSLDHIRRRARQRKTRQAVFAAAGCAVVIAAAVAVPQLVGRRQARRAQSPDRRRVHADAAAPAARQRARPSSGTPDAQRAPRSRSGPRSRRPRLALVPPLNFQPTSVTIVGAGSGLVGAVIGQAGTPGHCSTADCTSLAGTSNYGASWYGVSAPVAPGPNGSTGVSQLRFANISDGWAFGPALYETSDGGWPWTQGRHRWTARHRRRSRGRTRLRDLRHLHRRWLRLRGELHELLRSTPRSPAPGPGRPCRCPPASRRWPRRYRQPPLLVISGGTTVYVLTPSGEVLSGPVTGGTWRALGPAPCKPGAVDVAAQDAQNPGAQLAAGPLLHAGLRREQRHHAS